MIRRQAGRTRAKPSARASSGAPVRKQELLLEVEALRQRLEEAQGASAYLAAIVNSSDNAIFGRDLDGTILTWNASAERIFGYSAGEIIGHSSSILQPPEHAGGELEILKRIGRGETIQHYETELLRKDGQRIHVSLSVSPVRSREGQLEGASTIARDITEHKLADEVLHKQRQWLDVTLQSIGDAVLATDAGGRIAFLNPVAATLTGWTEAQALGQPAQDVLRTINERTREPAEDIILRVLREGCVVSMANHTALVARDGREIPIEDSAAPIRDSAGNVLGVVLVFHDVTEKRRAHRELQNVLNSISDGLLVLDRNWRHTYFSEQGARMIGMRREDLIGACIWEVFPHAKGTRFYEEYHRAVETGQPATFEEYYPEPLNKWFECHCYPSETGLSVYFQDITKRKRAEEEMAWLASFPERNANPIAEIEPLTGVVQYVNPAGRRLFPDLRERGLSHPWLAGLEQVADTLAKGNGNSVLREVMVGDHCYEQSANYIAEKERLRIYGIDITERKRADEALRRSRDELELRVRERTRELSNANVILSAYIEERERAQAALHESELAFRTLAESVPQLVWTCNPDGLPVYFNQRWVEYTGLTLEESYGRGWNTPFHPDDRQAAWQAWNHAVESGDTYRVESRLRRADGSYHWFLMRGVPSRDEAGQIVKWFGTCTDIDDLKQAEHEARSARERLALALKVGFSGTFEWDIRNNVNVWTPEVEELYGLAPGTFGGRYEDWEAFVLPEDLPHARACLEESLKTGEFFSEWRIRRAGSGEIRWIVANAKVSFDEEGRPVRMIGFNRDITDRKQAELEVLRLNQDLERRVAERTIQLERTAAELEKRNREVERVNQMKTEFLARSSHELRTPLNAIVGYADLLGEQSAGPLPPPYPRFVSNIQEGARHLLDMVNDLLDISRIEAGRIELNLERFEVSAVLDEVLSVITPLAEIKRIAVENRIARDTAVVADRLRFKQILYNLTSNAVKFTPEEGRVWIETAMEGEILTISVGDTGIGIAVGEQEAIFEEFHQVASARKLAPAGAGLGLAITRKLVRLHGGDVRVESEMGKGSRFLVSLPVAAKSNAPERMEADAKGVGSGR